MRLVEMFGRFDLQLFETGEYNTPNQMEMMANPDYWREKKGVEGGVHWMTPTEYIRACEIGFRRANEHGLVRSGRNPELVKEYAQAMKQGDIFPMLELDYRDDFFGQEGLHRAMAAEMINVKKVPVFIMKDAPKPVDEDVDPNDIPKPQPIKLSGRVKKEAKIKEFMDKYHKVTQDHPFDSSQRIAWDGKAAAEVRPFHDQIHIAAVQTLAPGERTGSASGMIMTLVALSDETGVPLNLLAKPFGNMEGRLNKRQLKAWYKRKGFVPTRGDEMEYVPEPRKH